MKVPEGPQSGADSFTIILKNTFIQFKLLGKHCKREIDKYTKIIGERERERERGRMRMSDKEREREKVILFML